MYSQSPYRYPSPPLSPKSHNTISRNLTQNSSSRINYTANEVSRIVNAPVRQGQAVKGQSRINYVPYQKKVIDYQDRQRIQRVPRTRKVIDYEERTVVEEVPREVTVTDYYAVENITQYYKQIIPEKKIQVVPIEKKRKRVQYVPVEKQIVHYPQGHDQSKSRMILGNQGIAINNDAQFRKIDPKLIYQYSSQSGDRPIGYYEEGTHRNMSTQPIYNYSQSYIPQTTQYQTYSPQNIQTHYHQTIGFHPQTNSPRNTYIS